MINFTLTIMSQVISGLAGQKPVNDGKEIPNAIPWKWIFITRVIKEGLNGLAFTQFVFCAKQHDHNSGETFSTLIYGERFKQLKGTVSKPKPISLSKHIAFLEKRIADMKVTTAGIKRSNR